MEDIPSIIGTNLKKIRKKKQMTLESLSLMTGVSTSMLGEIERGVTNPTITTLWKIADGLKISLSELIQEEEPSVQVVYLNQATTSLAGDQYQILSLFKFDPEKKFEVLCKVLEPDAQFESDGHRKGVEEYLFISEGSMALQVGKLEYTLNAGDAIRFQGNVRHHYHNSGKTMLRAFTILYYGAD